MKKWFTLLFLSSCLALYCCHPSSSKEIIADVSHPEDNLSSEAKIELGRRLFFDVRLSRDESISCATCHVPGLAFTDGKKTAVGIEGRSNPRNSPTLLNAGYLKTVMFDAHLPTLEMQVIVPIQEHNEMDMNMKDLIERLSKDAYYSEAAKRIYDREFDPWVLTRSIAAFERSLVSMNSRFDQYYYYSDFNALDKDEIAGWKLFSEKLYCTSCHAAPHFTNHEAANNGLYQDYGEDQGRFRIHNDSADMGKFKVPTLRNIELTAPYMHDGSMNSLIDVINHYQSGGNLHVNKNQIIQAFVLTNREEEQLISFLKSLTDTSYMKDFKE